MIYVCQNELTKIPILMHIKKSRQQTKLNWFSCSISLFLLSCVAKPEPSSIANESSSWIVPSCYQFTADLHMEDGETDPSRLAFVSGVERMKLLHKYPPYTIELDYTNLFQAYTADDAALYILEYAASVDILMLNEAHHYPTHRRFARSLLKGLWDANYRYFGLEALSYTDHFDQPTYPTRELGFSCSEPSMAFLLREAIELGFTLFPYEYMEPESGPVREQAQAEHIADFLADHKEGKTFIYCGYMHNFECELPEWDKAMVERLKELVEVEILTVNQWYFNDIAQVKSTEPIVLIDSLGQSFQQDQCNDIFVFHPKYDYSESRCNWKADETTEWKKVDFIPESAAYPLLVFSYFNEEEKENGVPFDCIELTHPNQIDWILLPKNQPYQLVVIDRNRKIVPLHL